MLALYQWQVSGQSPAEIGRHFHDDPIWVGEVADSLLAAAQEATPGEVPSQVYDHDLFDSLLQGVPRHLGEIDALLGPLCSRVLNQVDPVELAVLRLGAYELLHCPEVPYRVVINEAVDLTKDFGGPDGHRFVNGVLDKAARRTRALEMRSAG